MNLLWRVGPRWQDRPSVLKVYVLVDNKQETKFFFFFFPQKSSFKLWVYVHLNAGACRGQMRVSAPLELQVVMSHLM